MTPEDIAAAAESLFQAERSGRQTGLLSCRHPEMTLDDAYAVQAALVARKRATGRHGIGWKIGLTLLSGIGRLPWLMPKVSMVSWS